MSIKKPQHQRQHNFTFFVVPLILVLLVVLLAVFAIKTELDKLASLRENERVLLLRQQKPVAMLFFNVSDRQIVFTDLSGINFDQDILAREATASSKQQQNLLYAFLLGVTIDQSYECTDPKLDRETLTNFFVKQKPYYLFLKDKDIFWREQKFELATSTLIEPVFNCPVVLINTTLESGLATNLAAVLEKSAFSVIGKDSNTDNLPQTKILYDPNEPTCGQLLHKLSKILPADLVIADAGETTKHRATMVIYIGRDLADLYAYFTSK